MSWKTYRKTANIKAIQVTDESLVEIGGLEDIHVGHADGHECRGQINTLEGQMLFSYGDWIAEGAKGEHYSIENEVFQMTYEEVLGEAPPFVPTIERYERCDKCGETYCGTIFDGQLAKHECGVPA